MLLRTAWLCDDAYITYRCVDNFVNGHGMTYNPGQRVQAYTHPLWAFLHLPFSALFKDAYVTGLLVSITTSIIAVAGLIFKVLKENLARIFVLLALLSSSAFMDYCTSGLENPLTNLLMLGIMTVFLVQSAGLRKLFWIALLAALLLLNRMDAILLAAPICLLAWWRQRSLRATAVAAAGLLPFILWVIFALYYYGFLFPNTAYAKLNTGIANSAVFLQGLNYYWNSLRLDPVTLTLICGAIVAPFSLKLKKYYTLSIGILLYLIYVIYIGGDFMSGRFFACPFFMAMLVLTKVLSKNHLFFAFPVLIVLGIIGHAPAIFSRKATVGSPIEKKFIDAHGIADERAYYFQHTRFE